MQIVWKTVCVVLCLTATCSAGPLTGHQKRKTTAREDKAPATATATATPPTSAEVQEIPNETETESAAAATPLGTLTLPSNATSIRADITDNFSCANKTYGYYADVENDCQIFHVCLPVTYADGRENTFRWSFICPEDTIFSQESFTCMRREDMTIECEDSARYYELNGNFGGAPVQEEDKQQQQQQQVAEPEEEEEEQSAPATAPVEPEPKPVVAQPSRPVKVQAKPKPKPNRRKPQPQLQSQAQSQPQRKPPVPVAPEPQRFTMRPHKPQPLAAAPVRNELFAGIRKRPAIFNKPTTTPRPVEELLETEPVVTEAPVLQLSEPQPTVQLQTMFEEAAEEVPEPEPEPEVQASEPAVAIAEPEEATPEKAAPIKMEIATGLEEVKPIEAIEEIPAVIVESLEGEGPQDTEEKPLVEEIKPAAVEEEKEVPAAEEEKEKPSADEEKEVPAAEEDKEVPAAEEDKEVPAAEEDKEVPAADEEKAVPAKVEQSQEGNRNKPAITETDEEILSSIEALETARPADAPESIAATPEMHEHSPLVEEILLDNKETQESLGGFKPVDPAMAAEAEQLITDFLNTLKKGEEKPETELATAAMDMAETLGQELDTKQSPDVSVEEAKLPEPEIVDKNASIEEQLPEESALQKSPPKIMTDSPIIQIMQYNHLPMDYQIPVQVVPLGEEEVQPQAAEAVPEEATAATPEEAGPQTVEEAPAAYMPSISIDDIVELVKERLDQTPKNQEQMAPMELVVTPGAAAPLALIQSPKPSEPEQALEPEQEQASEPEQEMILPIYKRVSMAEPAMTKVQTLPVTVSKVDAETDTAKESQSQAESQAESQSQSLGKMDARKRRFLFRADAS
ncbi:titin homolog [Drosophila persimilis]|uniref:titin homolog n=1 Tax=Drosophila persimilis TaxID=7234 RepID=UPI000F07F9AB|nr:titin homolog [Drosophila persimilis]